MIRIARRLSRCFVVPAFLAAAGFAGPAHAQVVTATSGANAGAIQAGVDSYRAQLGTLNANVVGSFGSGRREINWDGVPDALSAPNALPANFFNTNSPRGVTFVTPGVSFQVSAKAGLGTPVEFSNLNPTYESLFEAFSPQRLFAAIGSNIVDVNFFVPGSPQAALTRGFGAVFTDVDLADTTSLSFFDLADNLLGTFFVPAFAGNETFSFLGVDFGTASVSRVRITNGSAALGGNETTLADLVVMDDFLYGEPIAVAAIPEPEVYAMLLGGLGLLGWRARRRKALARCQPSQE